MRKLRWLRSCGFEDQNVLEGVGEMVLAANNVRDAQVRVVGAGSQVIGRHPVRTQEGEVLDIVGGLHLLAIYGVVKMNLLADPAWNTKPQGKRLSRGGAAIALLGRKLTHPGIEKPRSLRPGFLGISCVRGSEVAIRQSLLKNRPRRFLVQRQPLGLLVLFVPPQIEPRQPFEN